MSDSPKTKAGLLSVVGTPIGNLGDLSPRAGDVLGRCDAILCEDTRVTSKLMAHLGLRKPLVRCDENVIAGRVPELISRLQDGAHLAFVSDAGMPGLSDPGQRLLDAALDEGLPVEVVPGPSAAITALVASGLPMDRFFFEGFLPRKAGERLRRLEELRPIPGALVLYESPHRVEATIQAIAQAMPRRTVALVRELTKVHEECRRASAPELAALLAAEKEAGQEVRGECVVVVSSPDPQELEGLRQDAQPVEETLEQAALRLRQEGLPASKAAKELRRRFSISRDVAYDAAMAAGEDGKA